MTSAQKKIRNKLLMGLGFSALGVFIGVVGLGLMVVGIGAFFTGYGGIIAVVLGTTGALLLPLAGKAFSRAETYFKEAAQLADEKSELKRQKPSIVSTTRFLDLNFRREHSSNPILLQSDPLNPPAPTHLTWKERVAKWFGFTSNFFGSKPSSTNIICLDEADEQDKKATLKIWR